MCHVYGKGRGGPVEGVGASCRRSTLDCYQDWVKKGRRTQQGQRDGAKRARDRNWWGGGGRVGGGGSATQLTLGVSREGHRRKQGKIGSGASVRLPGALGRVVTVSVGSSEEGQELGISVAFTTESQAMPTPTPRAQGLETLSVPGSLRVRGPGLCGGKEMLWGHG